MSTMHEKFTPSVVSRQPRELHESYADVLSRYPWDCFATLTWRSPTGPEKIVRDFRTWIARWMGNEAVLRRMGRWQAGRHGHRLRGPFARKRSDKCVWVLGVEPHKSGKLHAHALLKFPECFGEVQRVHGWELWFERHGIAKLVPPRSQHGSASYVAKYVTKSESELVFSESFDAAAMTLVERGSAGSVSEFSECKD